MCVIVINMEVSYSNLPSRSLQRVSGYAGHFSVFICLCVINTPLHARTQSAESINGVSVRSPQWVKLVGTRGKSAVWPAVHIIYPILQMTAA